jgi:hypothetical protein
LDGYFSPKSDVQRRGVLSEPTGNMRKGGRMPGFEKIDGFLFDRVMSKAKTAKYTCDGLNALSSLRYVGVVAMPGPEHNPITDTLFDLGIRSHWFLCFEDLVDHDDWCDFDAFIISSDCFLSVMQMVEKLVDFRLEHDDTPILLVSSSSDRDDLSSSRSAICDATLTLPLGAERVREGLIATLTNNAELRQSSGRRREI